MSEPSFLSGLLDRARRHERALAMLWLVAAGLVGASVVVEPIRAPVLDRAQEIVQWRQGRWLERVEEGERLMVEGRWAEAVTYLERLDRVHPARNVRHARDKEREQVLRLLARSYEALDRRARTIETYRQLVAFDPNHYRNHFELAQASERLLSRATVAPEARDAYAAALALFPAHLPSVRGYIKYYLDQAEFIPVIEGYERYLDSYLVQPVRLRLGDAVVDLPVLVDGRLRDYEIPLATVWSARDNLTIATGGFASAVERAEVTPAVRVGVVDRADAFPVDLTDSSLVEFQEVAPGIYRPLGAGSALQAPVRGEPGPASGVRLRIALFKPVERELWTAVSKSYQNLLDDAARAAAARRTVALESPAAADLVMERLVWSLQGLTTKIGPTLLGPPEVIDQLLVAQAEAANQ